MGHQPLSTSLLWEDFWATVSFWGNGGCKGKPWQTLKNIFITQIQFIQLILWVNIFGEVGIANICILLSHFIISQCKYTYQGCVPTCSNYGEKLILELECGKPCQISNQHHCHHHHYHCQPTLSSPKSFHYKTYIFFLTIPSKSYRWLSNKGWQVRLISLTLGTVYLPQQAGTFPLCHPLLSRNIFFICSKLFSQKALNCPWWIIMKTDRSEFPWKILFL